MRNITSISDIKRCLAETIAYHHGIEDDEQRGSGGVAATRCCEKV